MPTSITNFKQEESDKTNDKYPQWKYSTPLPPDSLMGSVGGVDLENFLVVGDAWNSLLSRYISFKCTVLDIGCGCGRIARILLNNKLINKYIGFDIMEKNINWCKNYLSTIFSNSIFTHHDIYSSEYNSTGKILSQHFNFPVLSESIDIAFAASLFTHLIEKDCIQYLKEIFRILKTNGKAILSIHTNSGDFNYIGSEKRIDVKKKYFLSLAEKNHLHLEDFIDDFCGQTVLIFSKKKN
jgi:SAM-dependent methyltransferase